jgi:hypothetical protein
MMMKSVISVLAAGFASMSALPEGSAQQVCAPRMQWQQTYGGNSSDYAAQLQETSDGGFIIAGSSFTHLGNTGGGNKTAPFYGNSDFWVVRADSQGNKLWDQSYGGASDEHLWSVQQTADGGFILGGSKTSPNFGQADFWLVRTDSSGNKLWDRSFGGDLNDIAKSVRQTSDGGYVLAGYSSSSAGGNKTSSNFGNSDFWIVRTDANGQKLWDRSFGGARSDELYVVRETSDGGFLLAGRSSSEIGGNKTSGSFGYDDGWVVRIDANGDKLWDRSFGGEFFDEIRTLAATDDGGFVLGGISNSHLGTGNKTSANYGGYDFWAIWVDSNGAKLRDRTYGGGNNDVLHTVNKVGDGFILAGDSSSRRGDYGTKTSRSYGGSDYWVVRLDVIGNQVWDESVGSRESDVSAGGYLTRDGGFVAGGHSYGSGGSKTSPTFANGDFWLVKFQAETPGDCDGDGVPDGQDLCPDTPAGTVINSNGCAISQLCPCTNEWQSAGEYVRCVRDTAGDFVRAGLITEAERQAIVAEAETTNCPPVGQHAVYFGLTNVAIGQAVLNAGSSGTGSGSGSHEGPVTVSELWVDGLDGVSVLTGEADSGVFLYPDAPIWGNYSDEWFMLGRAYGRVNGTDRSAISSLRVTKPDYETYPVEIDFTPLAPQSLTFQIFSNRALVVETTIEGAGGEITIYSSTYLGPRGNPFWRMPDGSVGALIEFTTPVVGSGEYYPNSISGPFGNVYGDRIFIRANQPANNVQFVSRVDVTGFSGEFNTFSFLDERLGVFARPHKALGPVTMNAARGQLTMAGFTNLAEFFGGVLVELDEAARFDVNLAPLAIANPFASLTVSGAGADIDDEDIEGENDGSFAQAIIREDDGKLLLSFFFSPVYLQSGYSPTNPPLLQLKVFRNGALVGSTVATNHLLAGTLRGPGQLPEIIACGLVTGGSNLAPHFAFTLRRQAIFSAMDGTELRGNHVRVEPIGPATNVPPLVSFSLGTFGVPAFTITGERSVLAPPPLRISPTEDSLELSWPTVNQPFMVESAGSLSGPFSAVTNDVQFIDSKVCITLPVEPASSRFFRLRLSTD